MPEEDYGRYNTLSGMLMLLLGRVPHTADVAEWEGWRCEIVDMDHKRIDKVLATRLTAAGDTGKVARRLSDRWLPSPVSPGLLACP